MALRKRTWSAGVMAVLALVAMLGWWLWRSVSGPATAFEEASRVLYIRSGADIDEVWRRSVPLNMHPVSAG
jgi:hypothetical protein